MYNLPKLESVIEYIEEHLTEKIDYAELAKIMAVSEQSMQRIFVFITNISLSEYIKRRRFSRALEELKTSNIKIIDLAIKYQYESEISFSRAFKSYFKVNPSEAKKNSIDYIQYPMYQFNNRTEYLYSMVTIPEKTIYAYKAKDAKTRADLLFRIRELYQDLKDKNIYNELINNGMYGLSFMEENYLGTYYVGCEKDLGYDSEKIKIEAGNYLVFNCGGDAQSDIAPLIEDVYSQFAASSSINLDRFVCFELYKDNTCYLYVKKK